MRIPKIRLLCLLPLFLIMACNLLSPVVSPSPVAGENSLPDIPTPTLTLTLTLTDQETPEILNTPSPTSTIIHLVTPGTGAGAQSYIYDTISGDTAHQGQPNQPPGGDLYLYNLYERPFNANTQDVFFPDLDIRRAEIGLGQPWMYVTIYLYGLNPQSNALNGNYGVELDLNIDGRGEWLMMAAPPHSTEWSVNGVRAWHDTNSNVGQLEVCYADPPQTADSYDQLAFDQGQAEDTDSAWARYLPGDPPALQFAFKHALINNDKEFMWGVWADQGVNQPQWSDYHDHFTFVEAGAPFPNQAEYPIKAIAEVDNTCRWAYGFSPDGDEPCLCAGGVPTPTPSSIPYASLGGYVFKDLNNNRMRDAGDGGLGGATVNVRSGSCPGGAIAATTLTGAWGRYIVENLVPGNYCVTVPAFGSFFFTPPSYDVTLSPSEFRDNLDFLVNYVGP